MAWIPFERKGDYEDVYYRHHYTRRLIVGCCVLLCSVLVFAILVLGIATLVAYLILRPHTTHYEIVSATVSTLAVSGTSQSLTDTSTIDAQFTYGLRARNPNGKLSMEYSKFNVQTLFLGVDIGHSSIGGFRLGRRSTNTVPVTTSATGVVVNNIVGDTMRSEIEQGYVAVQVKIDTRARAHVGSYTSFWIWIHARCEVAVTPPSGGVQGNFVTAKCHKT